MREVGRVGCEVAEGAWRNRVEGMRKAGGKVAGVVEMAGWCGEGMPVEIVREWDGDGEQGRRGPRPLPESAPTDVHSISTRRSYQSNSTSQQTVSSMGAKAMESPVTQYATLPPPSPAVDQYASRPSPAATSSRSFSSAQQSDRTVGNVQPPPPSPALSLRALPQPSPALAAQTLTAFASPPIRSPPQDTTVIRETDYFGPRPGHSAASSYTQEPHGMDHYDDGARVAWGGALGDGAGVPLKPSPSLHTPAPQPSPAVEVESQVGQISSPGRELKDTAHVKEGTEGEESFVARMRANYAEDKRAREAGQTPERKVRFSALANCGSQLS